MDVENPKIIGHGLAYDDILIAPGYSDTKSRSDIPTDTTIARGLPEIHLPIVSANMDTVTESRMAMTMALHGGIGIIHRFLPPKDQAREVRLVKERMRILEENPPLLPETATIQDAQALLADRRRGYVIVHAESEFNGSFSGIATNKDFIAAEMNTPLFAVMTRREKVVTLHKGVTQERAVETMKQFRIEKLPIVDSNGKLMGVFTMKDSEYFSQYPRASLDRQGRLMVGAAIGVKNSDIKRARLLVEAGVDVLVLDIAHGHLQYTRDMLHQLKQVEHIQTPIIAGNVATSSGTLYLYESGADGIKVGVGPGFVCETRDVAGVGVPQVTAILEAANAMHSKKERVPIMADGGLRKPGDLPKAIAAGADSVMIGSLLAGTEESPGEKEDVKGQLMKRVRGMASASAFKTRQQLDDAPQVERQAEGRTTLTPFRGPAVKVLFSFRDGLQSGMSYVGAHSIREMQEKARFYTVSPSGANEQRRPLD